MTLEFKGSPRMDRTRFIDDCPGELVRAYTPDPVWAFVPAPLPRSWDPGELWPLIVEAREALARLDGTGSHMPNHDLLLRPLQRREALRSSSLEGTYASPEELLLFEMEPRQPTSDRDPANAWREVSNYGYALRMGQEELDQNRVPLSMHLVRSLHYWLVHGVRGWQQNPGELRKRQIHIGSERRFVPPPPLHLATAATELERFMNEPDLDIEPLVQCFMVHYQFETIHPFLDGNGRVGRLLLSLMIYKKIELSHPWLYLSAFFERYKDKYIDRLFNVSARGDWTSWIEFCLRATKEQAADSVSRFDKLVVLRDQCLERIYASNGSSRLLQILERLWVNPVVTIPHIAEELGVSYPTARTDVRKLMELGILAEIANRKPKVYFAAKVMDIAFVD